MNFKKIVPILSLVLVVVVACGCTESSSESKNIAAQGTNIDTPQSSPTPVQTTSQDVEWARNVNETMLILSNDSKNLSNSINKSDWYTTIKDLDRYKQDLDSAIINSDSFTVSPELQSCKDEYRLGLIDDNNAILIEKSLINYTTSGNEERSNEILNQVVEYFRSSNSHYDNVTNLISSYNINHPKTQLDFQILRHNIGKKVDQTSTDSTPIKTSTSETKTITYKEAVQNDDENEDTVSNVDTSENTKQVESSTHDIFDYCTWEAQTTKKIGDYYKAPENKSYVVVTLKINNTGDQTYSTNSGYWHLKISDVYYQHDSATYDNSLNHMTTDVAPGGKITTKIAYLVDGEPSTSDMDMFYDGPGSDGTIRS